MLEGSDFDDIKPRELAIRVALPLVLMLVAFYIRWENIPHFDFQVWQTALRLAESGMNPYDSEVLNDTLRVVSSTEGGIFTEENRETVKMQYFNPPWWLLQLKILSANALAMSLLGAVFAMGSLAWLGRRMEQSRYLAASIAPVYLMFASFGVTTFRFGQTGLWLAGLYGLYLVLIRSGWSGVPLMAMAFKPHIALAAGIGEFIANPKRRLSNWVPAIVAGVAASAIAFGPQMWSEYISTNLSDDLPSSFEDMTLRTMSTRFHLPSWTNLVGLGVALVVAVVTSHKWRAARPELIALWTTAITIFLSGHGFTHDWMWLFFVPVVCNWRVIQTVIVTTVVTQAHLFSWSTGHSSEPQLVSLMSLIALSATIYLGWSTYRDAQSNSGGTGKSEAVEHSDSVAEPVLA